MQGRGCMCLLLLVVATLAEPTRHALEPASDLEEVKQKSWFRSAEEKIPIPVKTAIGGSLWGGSSAKLFDMWGGEDNSYYAAAGGAAIGGVTGVLAGKWLNDGVQQAQVDPNNDEGEALVSERITSVSVLATGKQLQLQSLTYHGPLGGSHTWEMVTRAKTLNEIDAVFVLPVLTGGGLEVPHTLIVKQFRPPANEFVWTFMSAWLGARESVAQAAMRQLHAETDFTGVVYDAKTIPMYVSSSISDTSAGLVMMEVDLETPQNDAAKQTLKNTEHVVIKQVPIESLKEFLDTVTAKPGVGVDSVLYSTALGLSIATLL